VRASRGEHMKQGCATFTTATMLTYRHLQSCREASWQIRRSEYHKISSTGQQRQSERESNGNEALRESNRGVHMENGILPVLYI